MTILIGVIFLYKPLLYQFYDLKEYWILKTNLVWDEERKLTWTDFNYDPTLELTDNISTNVGISTRYHVGDSIELSTHTVFVFKESFVTDTTDFVALRIAQARFDLCEVYRRKLVKSIDSLRTRNIREVSTDTIINRIRTYNESFEEEWNQFLYIPEKEVYFGLKRLENKINLELGRSIKPNNTDDKLKWITIREPSNLFLELISQNSAIRSL